VHQISHRVDPPVSSLAGGQKPNLKRPLQNCTTVSTVNMSLQLYKDDFLVKFYKSGLNDPLFDTYPDLEKTMRKQNQVERQ
jgi:hypothetical protein